MINLLKKFLVLYMGQKCSSTGGSKLVSLDELKDLQIGDKYIGKGCTANVAGTGFGSGFDYATKAGFGWPDNGEFDWGGAGPQCNMCADGWGCDQCVDNNGNPVAPTTVGVKPTITRVAFKGDPTACCLNVGSKTQGINTCDPKYRRGPQSPSCQDVYAEFCTQGDNALSDGRCAEWAQMSDTNRARLYARMLEICKNNPDGRCKSALTDKDYRRLLGDYLEQNPLALHEAQWRDLAHGTPGSSNIGVAKYCDMDGADPNFCSCINVAHAINGAFPPHCISSTCNVFGYRNNEVSDECNGVYTICQSNLNISAGHNVNIDGLKITQNCGGDATKTTTNTTTTTSSGTTTSTTTSGTTTPKTQDPKGLGQSQGRNTSTNINVNAGLFSSTIWIFIILFVMFISIFTVFMTTDILED